MLEQQAIRHPGVIGFHGTSKRVQQPPESPSEIPEPDHSDLAPGEDKGSVIALKPILFFSLAESAIGIADPACQVYREGQRHFGNRHSERRACHQYANTSSQAVFIVDVWKKVSFDIEDCT